MCLWKLCNGWACSPQRQVNNITPNGHSKDPSMKCMTVIILFLVLLNNSAGMVGTTVICDFSYHCSKNGKLTGRIFEYFAQISWFSAPFADSVRHHIFFIRIWIFYLCQWHEHWHAGGSWRLGHTGTGHCHPEHNIICHFWHCYYYAPG